MNPYTASAIERGINPYARPEPPPVDVSLPVKWPGETTRSSIQMMKRSRRSLQEPRIQVADMEEAASGTGRLVTELKHSLGQATTICTSLCAHPTQHTYRCVLAASILISLCFRPGKGDMMLDIIEFIRIDLTDPSHSFTICMGYSIHD
jgi:hypothetical protein